MVPWDFTMVWGQSPSMSFNPDFILILSWFYPDYIQINLDKICINLEKDTLSKFYPDFILISSWFYPDFTLISSK